MLRQVVRKYPDLFSGENNVKKLFFAIRFILKEHHSRRAILSGSNVRSVQSTQSASAEVEEVLDLVRKSLMLTYNPKDTNEHGNYLFFKMIRRSMSRTR